MSKVITIGLDIAKNFFQVHGVDASGLTVVRQKLRRSEVLGVLRRDGSLPCGYRSLRNGALLGPLDRGIGTHGIIKSGSDYRPFFEGTVPGGRTPLSKGREGASVTL